MMVMAMDQRTENQDNQDYTTFTNFVTGLSPVSQFLRTTNQI